MACGCANRAESLGSLKEGVRGSILVRLDLGRGGIVMVNVEWHGNWSSSCVPLEEGHLHVPVVVVVVVVVQKYSRQGSSFLGLLGLDFMVISLIQLKLLK